jgi:ubiquitin carboxyl-terminal hydrolase 14
MNATLQCLKSVPELSDAVKQFLPSYGHSGHAGSMIDGTQTVTNALKTTYQQLDVTNDALMPLTFLATMHREFPRFAEKDDHGHLMQQDANEFWVQLIQILQMNLPGKKENNEILSNNQNDKSFIDQYFGISSQST